MIAIPKQLILLLPPSLYCGAHCIINIMKLTVDGTWLNVSRSAQQKRGIPNKNKLNSSMCYLFSTNVEVGNEV